MGPLSFLKVTRVDGSKIIVLCLCVTACLQFNLYTTLLDFTEHSMNVNVTGGHPSYILIFYYQRNNTADTQTYDEWSTQAPLLKDPEITQANRPSNNRDIYGEYIFFRI
jgi:hypothetical protein